MFFENTLYRKNQFFNIYNNNDSLIIPIYTKGGSWLKVISISNFICAYTIWLIINHVSIGEYRAKFFSNKNISYLYNSTQLETCYYILYQCPLYSSYNYISKIVDFLQSNLQVFCFMDNIE